MTFLTPPAALVALAVLAPVAAALFGLTRVRAARRELALQAPSRWSAAGRLGCGLGAIALLGLAAAQPALTDTASVRERTDAAVLFVFDISRSMAASATPDSPTRLERAVDAAVELRAGIPEVPAGIATLTDGVLPDLLPVADIAGFDAVARHAVAIDNPPPSATEVVATSYSALSTIASGNYFAPKVTRRIVVLLGDGESSSFNPSQVASALPPSRGYRFLAVRFWNANEKVFFNGRADPAYHPNPAGASIMAGLASALGGRSFAESDIGAAGSYLQALVGTGPTVKTGTVSSQRSLAPFVAALAALLLLAAVLPAPVWMRVRAAGRRRGSERRVRSRTGAQGTEARDLNRV